MTWNAVPAFAVAGTTWTRKCVATDCAVSSSVTVLELLLTTARSARPSPVKSAGARVLEDRERRGGAGPEEGRDRQVELEVAVEVAEADRTGADMRRVRGRR